MYANGCHLLLHVRIFISFTIQLMIPEGRSQQMNVKSRLMLLLGRDFASGIIILIEIEYGRKDQSLFINII